MDIGKLKKEEVVDCVNQLYAKVDNKPKTNSTLINVANIILFLGINTTIDGVLIMIDDHYDEI